MVGNVDSYIFKLFIMKSLSSMNLNPFSNEQMQKVKGGRYTVIGRGSMCGRSLEDRDYGSGGTVCDVVSDSE